MMLWILLWLFLDAIIFKAYTLIEYVTVYDEGIILTGAERVLKGDRPYVEFWSMYPPGQFFTLAFLFKLFGISVFVERIYDLVIKSLISILTYLVILKVAKSKPLALLGWIMSLLLLTIARFHAYPIFPAVLFVYVGIFFYLLSFEKNRNHYLVFSALSVVLSATFRHDLGVMAAFAFLVVLLLRRVLHKRTGSDGIYYFIFTWIFTVAIISGYLAYTIGLNHMVNQLIVIPSENMPKYRWLPYPTSLSLRTCLFFIFPLTLFGGLFTSLTIATKNKTHSMPIYGMLLISLIGILFLNQARVRSDLAHLIPAGIFSLTLIPCLFFIPHNLIYKMRYRIIFTSSSLIILIVTCIPLGMLAHRATMPYFMNYWNKNYILSSTIERVGYADMGGDLRQVVEHIRKSTDENDAIYVGVTNHDQFTINDVIIYFLTGRQYPTRYHWLEPGLTTTPEIQKEIVEDLRRASVKIIVLAKNFWPEPNNSSIDQKTDILDSYISTNYRITNQFEKYEIWEPI